MKTKVEMTKREAQQVASTLKKVQKIFARDDAWVSDTWATHILTQPEIKTLQRLGLWADVEASTTPGLHLDFHFHFSGRGSSAANASGIARRIKKPNCYCLGGAICKARGTGGPDHSDLYHDPISVLTCCVLCEAIGSASLKQADRYTAKLWTEILPKPEDWPKEHEGRERASGMIVGWNDHEGRTIKSIRRAVDKALVLVAT